MTRSRVLVVEDDDDLGMTLAYNLRDLGYEVERAANCKGALALLGERTYELVILDIMLPDGDGYELCRRLRSAGHRARVLMLTARTLEEDIVRGFDAGADDYVAKPYRLHELIARVRALLRRDTGFETPTISFAGYRLELAGRAVLSCDGRAIDLTPKEFDLLAYLLRHRERALPRQQILDDVWGEDVIVSDRTIDNFVSSLKRKLGWTPQSKFSIKTVRGIGYRLEVAPLDPDGSRCSDS